MQRKGWERLPHQLQPDRPPRHAVVPSREILAGSSKGQPPGGTSSPTSCGWEESLERCVSLTPDTSEGWAGPPGPEVNKPRTVVMRTAGKGWGWVCEEQGTPSSKGGSASCEDAPRESRPQRGHRQARGRQPAGPGAEWHGGRNGAYANGMSSFSKTDLEQVPPTQNKPSLQTTRRGESRAAGREEEAGEGVLCLDGLPGIASSAKIACPRDGDQVSLRHRKR